MTKVYFISGLGADKRAFRALQLPGIEAVHLSWLPPLPRETMHAYAARMAVRITQPNPVIVGSSFGGMMAVEIAKHISVKKIILISSAKNRNEIPFYFRFCRFIPLHKLLPLESIGVQAGVMKYFFGTRTDEQRRVMKEVVRNEIPGFTKWAIHQLVNWKQRDPVHNIIHIHGTADHLLPCRFVKPDYTVTGGGHLMVVNQSKELSTLLLEILAHPSRA